MSVLFQQELAELLSVEYSCTPESFWGSENLLTVSVLHEGRRIYSPEKYFFHMVTTGNCVVITADECLHPFLREFIKGRCGHWLFEQPKLFSLEAELNRFGHTLTQSHHMFLPTVNEVKIKEPAFPIKWFYDAEINRFYGDPAFPNAICDRFHPERPDRIVVCACDGDRIIAMAGCSEDAPRWQQIGIDVLPAYRSRGIGTYLVKLLKDKILSGGNIPFYGTSLSNYHSWNIALNAGFRPAFVEIGSKPKEAL